MDSLYTAAAGSAIQPTQLGFPARGLIVDNITSQWYYEPSSRRYIPPYYGGVTIPLSAVQIARLDCQSPQGTAQPPVRAGEYLSASWTDSITPAGSGVNTQYVQAKPQYYDRINVATKALVYNYTGGGAYASSVVAQYTVASGRKAFVETAFVQSIRTAAATALGQWDGYVRIIGSDNNVSMMARVYYTDNTTFVSRIDRSTIGYMATGDQLQMLQSDSSNGGIVSSTMTAKIVEFDA